MHRPSSLSLIINSFCFLMLRTKYYFGGGQALICFGGSLMHGTDFHVHSLFPSRCIISDH
ncbi:hypothetical protein Fmac_029637 [Flemingia macrophylla]|uniref:Uncharacterized protein n=1 Tax=Flemingia macrophylla TaxID=520843 RepID=A0ABD1LAW8_9FABA